MAGSLIGVLCVCVYGLVKKRVAGAGCADSLFWKDSVSPDDVIRLRDVCRSCPLAPRDVKHFNEIITYNRKATCNPDQRFPLPFSPVENNNHVKRTYFNQQTILKFLFRII